MNWAWEQDLSGNEKLLLMAIADACNDHGYGWPSYATLANKCRCSRRTIIRVADKLSGQGYFRIDGRSRTNGSASSNAFQLNLYGAFSKLGGSDKMSPPKQETPEAGGDNMSLGGSDKTSLGGWCQNDTRVVSPVSPLEPSLNTLSTGEQVSPDSLGGENQYLHQPPPDFKPDETTLTRLKMNGHPEPTPDLILKFISHYEAKPTREIVKNWQSMFLKWAVTEKSYSNSNGANNATGKQTGRGRNASSPAGAAAAMSDFLQS